MYAILVKEPGVGGCKDYILPTGASTSESAMQLMSSRAEEFVDEQLEQSPTEDYTIERDPESLQVTVFFNSRDHGAMFAASFTASAIDEVV